MKRIQRSQCDNYLATLLVDAKEPNYTSHDDTELGQILGNQDRFECPTSIAECEVGLLGRRGQHLSDTEDLRVALQSDGTEKAEEGQPKHTGVEGEENNLSPIEGEAILDDLFQLSNLKGMGTRLL